MVSLLLDPCGKTLLNSCNKDQPDQCLYSFTLRRQFLNDLLSFKKNWRKCPWSKIKFEPRPFQGKSNAFRPSLRRRFCRDPSSGISGSVGNRTTDWSASERALPYLRIRSLPGPWVNRSDRTGLALRIPSKDQFRASGERFTNNVREAALPRGLKCSSYREKY